MGDSPQDAGYGTVTLLLGDVENSSQRWQADEVAAAAAFTDFERCVDEIVAKFGGVRPLEQGEGDSFVSAFARASDAVAAALALQHLYVDGPFLLRLALHTGETQQLPGGRIGGAAVVRCARIRDLAPGGRTLLSAATRELVLDSLTETATVESLGTYTLRGLDRPEHVWELHDSGLPRHDQPLRAAEHLGNVAGEVDVFVGRGAERAEVSALLRTQRMVTLAGAGGIGKTRLALRCALDARDAFPGGVWMVDLARCGSGDLVPGVVAATLRASTAAMQPVDAIVRLITEPTLLLFDNCEHLLDACAELSTTLRERCAHVVILATSREPLGAVGEIVWRVPSLSPSEALALFVDRAQRVRPHFALDDATTAVVQSLCEQLDAMPLAIELAAARVRAMPVDAIAAALQDRFRLLTGGRRDVPRHRTLHASVEWSYDLLTEVEQAALRRLSVFAGGFTLEAAEAICSIDGLDRYGVFDLLTQLTDRSLVSASVGRNGAVRYGMLESIRQFAEDRLAASGEAAPIRDRHRDFFFTLATDRAVTREWVRTMWADDDNIALALAWSFETSPDDTILRFVVGISPAWQATGRGTAPAYWLRRAVEATAPEPSEARAVVLGGLALALYVNGEFDEAITAGTAALEMFDDLGVDEIATTGPAHSGVGLSKLMTGDLEGARVDLAVSVESGADVNATAGAFASLTLLSAVTGDTRGAVALGRSALRAARHGADRASFVLAAFPLLFATARAGNLEEVAALEAEIAAADAQADNTWSELLARACVIFVAITRGSRDGLVEQRAALQHIIDRGETRGIEPGLHLIIGLSHAAEGDFVDAITRMERALGIYERTGQASVTPMPLAYLGHYYVADGQLDEARRCFELGLDRGEAQGNRHDASVCRRGLAVLDRSNGDLAACANVLSGVIAELYEIGSELDIAATLAELAVTLALADEGRAAVRLAAAAAGYRARKGLAFDGSIRTPTEAAPEVRAALPEPEFAAAWDEGFALSLDDAVAYALRGTGTRLRPAAGWYALTPVELDVARLIAEGLDNPAIAAQLFISRNTVKTHLQHIYAKLSISRRAELAAEFARRQRDAIA